MSLGKESPVLEGFENGSIQALSSIGEVVNDLPGLEIPRELTDVTRRDRVPVLLEPSDKEAGRLLCLRLLEEERKKVSFQ